jgi:hypothetical protein
MGKVIPSSWLDACRMTRIIGHWTAGGYEPNAVDMEHYHVLIDGDGAPHRGDHPIADNVSTADDDYAAHTRGCNTGAIGLSCCAMLHAQQDGAVGPCPVTREQWNGMILAGADLCRAYRIEPSPEHLLMHCEVQPVLGIEQVGKWDISRLVFDRGPEFSHLTPGQEWRARVKRLLAG